MIKGVSPDTEKVFKAISTVDRMKEYVLVGGTALSLQLHTRLSLDLDFMKWKTSGNDRPEIPWNVIKDELSNLGLGNVKAQVLDFNQALFEVAGVKLSFYSRNSYAPAELQKIPFHGNIRIADLNSIGVMKIEATLRRSTFRDYYDIYCILKNGAELNELIYKAAIYSGRSARQKNIISILSDGSRFSVDAGFKTLNPVYDVSTEDIQEFIKLKLKLPFKMDELPYSDFEQAGLSFDSMDEINKERLLKGEKTDFYPVKFKTAENTEKVQFFLNRNADNTVVLNCIPFKKK
jgi:hypothetical protein